MMKAINEKLGKKEKIEKVYLKLFEELDKMVKLQLIICPDSTYHRDESQLSFYKALKRMYEHLSHGTSFYDSATIRRFQIDADFKNCIQNESSIWDSLLDIDDVLQGDRNEWQSKLLVTVDFPITQNEIDSFHKIRLSTYENIKTIFETWKQQKTRSYLDFFKEIASSYGISVVNRYVSHLTQYFQGTMGVKTLTTEDILSFTGEESVLVSSLLRYLPDKAHDTENFRKVISYLKSDRPNSVPINEIYSAIWAAIAYQASRGGRTSPPNVGMSNDVEMVATLLPYCDAIFIDKDMYSILSFGEVKKVLSKYKAKIFSLTNKEDFFSYLVQIKEKTSKKHMETITKVYGDDWGTPFYGMYEEREPNS